MQARPPFIIAVDGYSSCGKSTFARLIAKELNFVYIDSGAMYRTVALYSLNRHFIQDAGFNQKGLRESLNDIEIAFKLNPETGIQETLLNGRNVEQEIRGIEVSNVVSKISQLKEVRQKMVKLQRNIGARGNVVMDGRDIGSTVFPNATLKIFMTADLEVRAERRYKELITKGIPADHAEVINNIRMRDHEDESRVESPLRRAEDAIVLDNSYMTLEEQMDWFREKWSAMFRKDEN
jgi:cytidylate kinase